MLRKFTEYRGAFFMGALVAVVLWLWATGQLSLYIHPRYHLFTGVMASIAVALILVWAFLGSKVRETVGHDHDHDHDKPGMSSRIALAVSSVLSIGALAILTLLPPATLSTLTAENRAINQSGLGDTEAVFDQAQGGQAETFASFTVREWAAVLKQTSDPAFYQGKPVDVVGFITEDPSSPDIFYVTRFVVSCCSVDAQPVGVAVSLPRWSDTYSADQWVRVSGEFRVNPDTSSTEPLVLIPREIGPTEQPNEPYLF